MRSPRHENARLAAARCVYVDVVDLDITTRHDTLGIGDAVGLRGTDTCARTRRRGTDTVETAAGSTCADR